MNTYQEQSPQLERFPGVDLALWTAMLMVVGLLAAVAVVVAVLT